MASQTIVVVGLGEIGSPLLKLISGYHRVIGVDIEPCLATSDPIDVMHICFPFQIPDFASEVIRYINNFQPRLTVINSTVAVGTTRRIAQLSGSSVVNSPVRGKHAHMIEDMEKYTKFIGGLTQEDSQFASEHFRSIGLKTRILSSPEATELAKLSETTYFGLLIAWAQQLERYCDKAGTPYDELIAFYEEIPFLPPVRYFPGIIGGHCVLPNIEILHAFASSDLVNAIHSSNDDKIARDRQINDNRVSSVQIGQTTSA